MFVLRIVDTHTRDYTVLVGTIQSFSVLKEVVHVVTTGLCLSAAASLLTSPDATAVPTASSTKASMTLSD